MTSVTRRRRSKGPDTRTGVEDALILAMEKLRATGRNFTSVSVEELAQEAGIARSTFYMHFQDKAELVRRLMKRVTRDLMEAAGSWLEATNVADRRLLRGALARIAEVYDRHRAIMVAIVETSAYDQDVAAMFHETMVHLSAELRGAIARAQRQGLSDPRLYPEMGGVLAWMVERACNKLWVTMTPEERERLLDALTHIFWNALFVPPQEPPGAARPE